MYGKANVVLKAFSTMMTTPLSLIAEYFVGEKTLHIYFNS